MPTRLINKGFLLGCLGGLLFVVARLAKYSSGGTRRELPLYLAVILVFGLVGGFLWYLAGTLRARRREDRRER